LSFIIIIIIIIITDIDQLYTISYSTSVNTRSISKPFTGNKQLPVCTNIT